MTDLRQHALISMSPGHYPAASTAGLSGGQIDLNFESEFALKVDQFFFVRNGRKHVSDNMSR